MMVVIAVGCSSRPRVHRESAATQPVSQAESQPAGEPRKPSNAVALRTAMLPDVRPQPFRIQLEEWRETGGKDVPAVVHEMRIEISGTLNARAPQTARRETEVKLVLRQIRVRFSASDRPDAVLSYDSTADRPDTGNPLADLLSHVVDAELTLRIAETRRLRGLRGLDAIWGRANLLMPPPPLLPVHWMFRDAGMIELASEALFPPMPFAPVRVGDYWETDIEANIPLVARLNSHVRGELLEIGTDPAGVRFARTEVTGEIVNAPEILQSVPAALQPAIKSASHTIAQRIDWNSHALEQTSRREMEIEMTLTPPVGGGERKMTIRQKRTVTSEREASAVVSSTHKVDR